VEISGVHKLKKNERLEMLSAYYRVPVCMIIKANESLKLEDTALPRELKIPKKCFCNECALNPFGTYSEN
jgi:hypothetical protein